MGLTWISVPGNISSFTCGSGVSRSILRSLQCMFVARESVVCYLHAARTFIFTVHLLLTDVIGGTLAAAFTYVCSGCLFEILLSCYEMMHSSP